MKWFLSLLLFFPLVTSATTANFGYEVQGTTSTLGGANNWARCSDYTSPEDMVTVDSATMYIDTMGTVGVKPVLWLADDETVFQVFPAITTGTGWQTSTLETPVEITGGTVFCIGWLYGDGTTLPVYDASSVTAWADVTNSYATPQSFGIDDTTTFSVSLYFTGTLAGGGGATTTTATSSESIQSETFASILYVFAMASLSFVTIKLISIFTRRGRR